MGILDFFKIGKVAFQDRDQIEYLVQQAKVMEGPKPSWKTGEFWACIVAPTLVLIVGSFGAFVPTPALPYFVIGMLVLASVGYLGRTALKIAHVYATKGLAGIDDEVLAEMNTVVTTLKQAFQAAKEAKAGNLDPAKQTTEQLNQVVVQK